MHLAGASVSYGHIFSFYSVFIDVQMKGCVYVLDQQHNTHLDIHPLLYRVIQIWKNILILRS